MTPKQRRDRIAKLFDQAVNLAAAERPGFLDDECENEPELRDAVEQLLDHHNTSGTSDLRDQIEIPTAAAATQPQDNESELPDPKLDDMSGEHVGPYKLLQRIGSGGFGDVYMADQEKPVRRRVALKIIKLGMDTGQVIARFEAERQALAMMDHPNIAKVLDAGATDAQSVIGAGRPYFVMELVKGEPITTYCDREKLSIADRLELFTQLCHAVQHAHQKAVIHRDIKPSNVLVSMVDGRHLAKVIDFGIAKATDHRLTEKTLFTEFNQMIGTPEYMSPEQAGGAPDIDTRTDIYSLGVLLYELLTGTPPFDPQQLRSAAYAEMQRIIREDEPPKPSTRVASDLRVRRTPEPHPSHPSRDRKGTVGAEESGQSQQPLPHGHDWVDAHDRASDQDGAAASSVAQIARWRRTDPPSLVRLMRGELDWIVMKCLEKDRARRYTTANDLAADIQHHLSGDPVVAAPPSRAYRLRKFIRRHRTGVLAGSLLALSIVIGIAGTTTFALREANARQEADRRAKETEKVAKFQAEMLAGISPQGMGLTIRKELRRQVEAGLKSRWVEGGDGRMRRMTEDETAAAVARFDEAVAPGNLTDVARTMMDAIVLGPAVTAAKEQFSDQPLVLATVLYAVGRGYQSLGLYDLAEPLLREALKLRTSLLGEAHRESLALQHQLSGLYREQGKPVKAESLIRDALQACERQFGLDDSNTLKARRLHAGILQDLGRLREAESQIRQTLDAGRRVWGARHESTIRASNDLGALLLALGRPYEAKSTLREAKALAEKMLGQENPFTLTVLSNYGTALTKCGEAAEASDVLFRVYDLRVGLLGAEHPDSVKSLVEVAGVLLELGQMERAESMARDALKSFERKLGPTHPWTLVTANNLAAMLSTLRQDEEAEHLYRKTLASRRRVFGNDHLDTLISASNFGVFLHARGHSVEGEALLREVYEMRLRRLGPKHPQTLKSMNNLATLVDDLGNLEEAETLHRRALALRREALGAAHPDTLDSMENLAVTLTRRGEPAEAEVLLREAARVRSRSLGDDHPDTLHSRSNLAYCLHARGAYVEAEQIGRDVLVRQSGVLGEAHSNTLATMNNLAATVKELGNLDRAEQLYRDAIARIESSQGAYSRDLFYPLGNLALLREKRGHTDEAEPLLSRALEIGRQAFPSDHDLVQTTQQALGTCLAALAKYAEAESLLLDSHEQLVRKHGPDHRGAVAASRALIRLYDAWHAAEPDEGYDAKAAEWRAKLPPADRAGSIIRLGMRLLEDGRHAEAEAPLRQCLEIRQEALAVGHWLIFNTISVLGESLAGQGADPSLALTARIEKLRDAEPLLLEGYEGVASAAETIPENIRDQRIREAIQRIVKLYEAWHATEPDRGYDDKAAEWRAKPAEDDVVPPYRP